MVGGGATENEADCDITFPFITAGTQRDGGVGAPSSPTASPLGVTPVVARPNPFVIVTPSSTKSTHRCYCRCKLHGLLSLSLAAACVLAGASLVSVRYYLGRPPGPEKQAPQGWNFAVGNGHVAPQERNKHDRHAELARLVEQCATSLKLPRGICGSSRTPIEDNSYHVPYMGSGRLDCGFEGLMTKENMDKLAANYVFRFIGASTTRRLTESFVSIYTGRASTHVVHHRLTDYSIGDLEVVFDWAPFCAGPMGISVAVNRALEDEQKNRRRINNDSNNRIHKLTKGGQNKRLVIVTAYGVHDATQIQEYQDLDFSVIAPGGNETAEHHLYANARKRHIFARDSLSEHGLRSCRQVTSELNSVAVGVDDRPKEQPLWHKGRARLKIQQAVNKKREQMTTRGGRGTAVPKGKAARINGGVGSPNLVGPGAEKLTITWDKRAVAATKMEADKVLTPAAEMEVVSRSESAKEGETVGDGEQENGFPRGVATEGVGRKGGGGGRRGLGRGNRGQLGIGVEPTKRHEEDDEGGREVGGEHVSDVNSDDGGGVVGGSKRRRLENDATGGLEWKRKFNDTGEERRLDGDGGGSANGQRNDQSLPPPPPPLVFLFQGNPFLESDPRDAWMRELHALQREELGAIGAVGIGEGGARRMSEAEQSEGVGAQKMSKAEISERVDARKMSEAGISEGVGVQKMSEAGTSESVGARSGNENWEQESRGVFLVNDEESLYGHMRCYRADHIHFLEPVKLIEAKMLWHLLALVDRGQPRTES